jgi:hypothetical protein
MKFTGAEAKIFVLETIIKYFDSKITKLHGEQYRLHAGSTILIREAFSEYNIRVMHIYDVENDSRTYGPFSEWIKILEPSKIKVLEDKDNLFNV